MKYYIILIVVGLINCSTFSQTNTFPSSGNVGIGTTSPNRLLDINGTGGWSGSGGIRLQGYNPGISIGDLTSGQNWLLANGVNIGSDGYLGLAYNLTTGTHNIVVTPSNNIGIGTTNPINKMDISGNLGILGGNALRFYNSANNAWATIQFDGTNLNENYTFNINNNLYTSGNVGIGTTSPGSKLQIGNYFQLDGNSSNMGMLGFNRNINTGAILNSSYGAFQLQNCVGQLQLEVWSSSGSLVTIHKFNNDGTVTLGGSLSGTNASFNGNTTTKKLIVTQTGWADYVFKPSYKLRSLSEVEVFIKVNKHLPEIPSAMQIEEKGIDVGETQKLLLLKVEELTLYMIEMKKEMEKRSTESKKIQKKLQNQIDVLKHKNRQLQSAGKAK